MSREAAKNPANALEEKKILLFRFFLLLVCRKSEFIVCASFGFRFFSVVLLFCLLGLIMAQTEFAHLNIGRRR